jgi:hypothetical protein
LAVLAWVRRGTAMGERDPEQARATVETWLEKQGYPLEYETARRLRAVGLIADQGFYYESIDAGITKVREIDVVAHFEQETSGVFVGLVAECKYVQAGWVVLTSTSPIAASIRWTALAASTKAKQVVGLKVVEATAWNAHVPEFLHMPERYGVGVAQVTTQRGQPDLAYEAITQAAGAALHFLHLHRDDLAVVWPFVVADGPLFQLGFTDDGKRLLESVLGQRVIWRGSSTEPLFVDIVSSEYFETYARRAAQGMREVKGALRNPKPSTA